MLTRYEYVEPNSNLPYLRMVLVSFPEKGKALPYLSRKHPLQVGDRVFVSGAMAGLVGQVEKIITHFSIDPEQYEYITGVPDTEIHGSFQHYDDYLYSLDSEALPLKQLLTWYFNPAKEDGKLLVSFDPTTFSLPDARKKGYFTTEMETRGRFLYDSNRVRYIHYANGHCTAVVSGTKNYLVEFDVEQGLFHNSLCNCPYYTYCKHEYSVMYAWEKLRKEIESIHGKGYLQQGSFGAVLEADMNDYVFHGRNSTLTI